MYAIERAVGIEAIIKASRLCQSVFKQLVKGETVTKADNSPVTIADFGAQAVVNAILQKSFSYPIVGEEDAADLRLDATLHAKVTELANSVLDVPLTSEQVLTTIDAGTFAGGKKGRFWTLDPIDGTKGFLRGEQFAVCLALIEDGDVKVGVMGCPNLPRNINNPNDPDRGTIFVAVKGEGAFQRSFDSNVETRIHVADISSPAQASFCESVEAAHSSQSDTAVIAQRLGITKAPVRMDSQCKYGCLARGDASIYLRVPTRADYEEKIWDHAGGALIVVEAGGQISDVTGAPLDFSLGRTLKANKGVVAANSTIFPEVIAAVKQVLNKLSSSDHIVSTFAFTTGTIVGIIFVPRVLALLSPAASNLKFTSATGAI
ncbi:3'(2'),5'-bisphosphate nucleotidase [Synchytrium microbalum]|uniref:3'(2'),5'-bisphosphate nucleotidase n=1 Tax=Synchytrium microbalum TaxID=1806994 RepID=A0A507C0L0_9FUNG|nr:3'(2'),5'-bisphosphate nucleotidase [Synchytrium microbalum]TPX33222.1 3'(2'),5'-bisphosphate nucleotidase [Synchytrium microbalum]